MCGVRSAMAVNESTDELLQSAYRELVTMQNELGRKVVDVCIYPPNQATLDTMKEHGYVMEAMTAVSESLSIGKVSCDVEMAMSNFQQITKHPIAGEMQLADWFDLGERFYVVRFPDGQRFSETEIACEDVACSYCGWSGTACCCDESNCQGILDSSNTALTDCLGAFKDNPIKRGE